MTGCARSKSRRAIGWIAAYTLALQTLVGSFGLIQTTASAAAFDPLAIICLNGGHGGAGDQTPGSGGQGGRPGLRLRLFSWQPGVR